jgi:lipoprotein LprG
MRKRISLAVAVPFISAAVALAGCSSSGSEKSDTPLPDAASLLTESAATTKTETSTHLVLTTSGDKPVIKIKELTGDLTKTPAIAAKGTAKLDFGGQSVEGNFVVVDGDLYADLLGGMQNFGKATDIYDPSIILDPEKGLSNLLANIKDAKSEGRDTVDGVESIRITGTLGQEAINTFAASKIDAAVPAKVWIAEGGKHELSRISIDTSPGNTIQMTLSDWGKPVSVVKP